MPLLALQGLEGKLFIPVALAIIFALAASLLLALTVLPVATSFLLKADRTSGTLADSPCSRGYAPALGWALANERKVMIAAVAALIAAGFAYTQLGKTFMPTMDEGDIIVSVEAIPSINLDQSIAINARLQAAILARVPDVAGIVARTGSDELGLDPMGPNQTDTFLVLKPLEERKTTDKSVLLQQLRHVLADFPGLSLSFTQPIDMRVQEMISGVRGDVAVKIFGPDITKLNEIASKLSAIRPVSMAQRTFTRRSTKARNIIRSACRGSTAVARQKVASAATAAAAQLRSPAATPRTSGATIAR